VNTLNERTQVEATLVDQIQALALNPGWEPEYDLTVNHRDVRLIVDMPGVLRENFRVLIQEGRIELFGHRLPAYAGKALEHTSTRRTGRFALDVEIPTWVDPKRAFKTFEGGLLTVVVPRRRESQPNAHARQ